MVFKTGGSALVDDRVKDWAELSRPAAKG